MSSTPALRVFASLAARGLVAAERAGLTQGASPSRLSMRAVFEASDLSAQDFADEVAQSLGLERATLAEITSAPSLGDGFSERFLRESVIFPFKGTDGRACVAMADPGDAESLRAAEIALDAKPRIVVASFEDIASALDARPGAVASQDAPTRGAAEEESLDNLRDLASGAPVVRAFDALVEKAVDLRASDIHIEPTRAGLSVRMRVDGVLRAVAAPAGAPPQALISRIKILAGLNIAERRLPQDGGARLKAGRIEVDVRVATLPTQHGESAVIRLLPRDRGLLDIEKLGFQPPDEARIRRALDFPNGMIVVTGPTGSGKTTTLATLLSALNSPAVKILTIEDPIEYEIAGIVQVPVKTSVGLSFAAAMRAFVRQDPDIIMIGEVRDAETAHIAVHAALTGHLVLTTLHTETASGAVPRLIDLGVEPFLLKSTLRLVVAQRLVRVLCERCKTSRRLTPEDVARDPRLTLIGVGPGDTVCEPKGCERCGGGGFRGRIGVFEAFEVAGEAREQVRAGVDSHAIEQAALRSGMATMTADAIAKARAGVTSVAEALRIAAIR
ncbi:MAG: type II/IV secretion system protein [Pseudomonadota bacterium]|nr:type II/IV secretion system protein [Pseudomonadota bacterium]